MKKILGLDLGTTSIGWALIEQDFEKKAGKILGTGVRIIPTPQDILGEFERGNKVSQTANRTAFRGVRRIRERHLLRRERLHRVLNILNFLPEHYSNNIDFEKNLGKFKNDSEPKLPYNEDGFIFKESFENMLKDFKIHQPDLVSNNRLVPYDWTIYFLRKKALTDKITKEELAWIILNFNQKRGYYQLRGEDIDDNKNDNKIEEFYSLKIVDVIPDEQPNHRGDLWYSLKLENGWIYRRSSRIPLDDWKDTVKDFIVTTEYNDDGTIKTDKEGNERRSFRAPKEDDWGLVKKKTENEINNSKKTVGAYIYDTLLSSPNQKIRGSLISTIERKRYRDELEKILYKQIELQPELFTEDLYNKCIKELYRHNDDHQFNLSKRDFVHLFINDIIFYQRPLRSQKSNISNCPLEYRYKNIIKTDNEGNRVKDSSGKYIFELDDNNKPLKEKAYLKVIHKSNPYYQEFRIWQWLYNLKIFLNKDETDVTNTFLSTSEDIETLFDFLNERKAIKQNMLLEFLISNKNELKGKVLREEATKYRWNYVEDKEYPMNETRYEINNRLKKVTNLPDNFLATINSKDDTNKNSKEYQLWHIIYSVSDVNEFKSALKTFATKNNLDVDSFVENFANIPPYANDYGAFSEKAIKRLLPLMRIGKYWDWNSIDSETKKRIDKLITGEFDENIKNRVREKAITLTEENHFQGLQLWLAQYIVYDRHSEAGNTLKWKTPKDINNYLDEFKQHSLRNPIVEQVVLETLRVVRDIWVQYGNSKEDYFDEIHIELAREMKNTAEQRKRLTNIVSENENTNQRIKHFLAELKNDSSVEDVRPHSPMQQEILRIFEDGALSNFSEAELKNEKLEGTNKTVFDISRTAQPTRSELIRYRAWLEQQYRSPYTGRPIPLSRLFTTDYQIEHIIPQSKFFDDSFSNKVICEAKVNLLKSNQLAYEFIKNNGGTIVDLGFGQNAKLFTLDEYKQFVEKTYANNRIKKSKLLMDEVPETMSNRQLNDTRYISKYISSILSNIVRSETNDDGVNSKNLHPMVGAITSRLKQDWGLNEVWNDLILPRFERMNELTNSSDFTAKNSMGITIPTVPLELAKGFQKKRIDHRHHAMDALVIACATKNHINLLNNQSAQSHKSRYDLQHKLRHKSKYIDNNNKEREKFTSFIKPWETFTSDAKNHLEQIVVSFKQNLRVINKTKNKHYKYVEENGKMVKRIVSQTKGDNWAIRKSLHKDTVSGKIKLQKRKNVSLSVALDDYKNIVDKSLRKKIDSLVKLNYDKKRLQKYFRDREYKWNEKEVSRVDIYYWHENLAVSRVSLDTTFNTKKIDSISDSGIQQILINHLKTFDEPKDNTGYGNIQDEIDERLQLIKDKKLIEAPELAFTPEQIEEMNNNIYKYNNGKQHKPIYKVRTYEPIGNKFRVGERGNKKDKYVEADKGTNLYFAIYIDENNKRSYETIPLHVVVNQLKDGYAPVPERNLKGDNLLFYLSPNDLVYVLDEDEVFDENDYDVSKIYKMVSSSKTQCFFINSLVSNSIVDKAEFSALNKMERDINGTMIKDKCIKLKTNRLGNISKA